MKVSKYHTSFAKRLLDILCSIVFLLSTAPIIILVSILNLIFSGNPIFFKQKRCGLNGKVFIIYKFRTMIFGAEKLQYKYKNLNQNDGPTFKIKDDPRFTKFGKILSRTGLDELPQFFNVLKGEMSIVGPRPLPISEARKLNSRQKLRELVKPGITSSWVIGGSHNMSFKKWMEFDSIYVEKGSVFVDIKIIFKTGTLILGYVLKTMGFKDY